MNIDSNDIGFILGIIGIFSAVVTWVMYLRKPQEDLEKKQLKSEEDLKDKATVLSQKEVESRAAILAQQVQWEKEANEKKFAEFGLRLDGAMTLAQNHIHTVDTKVDKLLETVGTMSNRITELSTIINERIPKKN